MLLRRPSVTKHARLSFVGLPLSSALWGHRHLFAYSYVYMHVYFIKCRRNGRCGKAGTIASSITDTCHFQTSPLPSITCFARTIYILYIHILYTYCTIRNNANVYYYNNMYFWRYALFGVVRLIGGGGVAVSPSFTYFVSQWNCTNISCSRFVANNVYPSLS